MIEYTDDNFIDYQHKKNMCIIAQMYLHICENQKKLNEIQNQIFSLMIDIDTEDDMYENDVLIFDNDSNIIQEYFEF